MKNLLLAANWKSNLTKIEAKKWVEEVSFLEVPENLEIVIFPPFTLLDILSGYIRVNSLPFKLGAQDISPFPNGSFTGEVSSEQIKEFADYVLIGHSERRLNFAEDEDMIMKKLQRAAEADLSPIVCVSDPSQAVNLSNKNLYFAYEPIGSIGTGNAESPDIVEKRAQDIKSKTERPVIYGGSVNAENIKGYAGLESINGVLVGGESLNASSFIKLVKNVT
jgi:triosephosphate isomerase (TIM)